MRLLVTGGSGFLGGYVLREAARRGHAAVALARSDAAAAAVSGLGAQPVAGDLDDPAALGPAFAAARCDVLVNLASLGFGHGPVIVAAARDAGISRAVFVSTTAVTTTLAAPSKRVRLSAEQRIRTSGLDWTILRPTMIYGAPGDRNLSRLLALLTRTPVLPVPGGGTHLQQPVHVADLAAAVLTATERPAAAGACYDVAGPRPLAFAELLAICAGAVASRTRFVPVPLAPLVAAARGYEQLSRRPRIRAEQLQRLAEDKAFDIGDAVRELDYAPRSFAVGIRAEAQAMGLAR
ncbi:MAG: NAD-dependent epimerase/dehydratase family protein [Streptosporangiaceae bacterium]